MHPSNSLYPRFSTELNAIAVSDLQSANASSPIFVTLFGSVTEVSAVPLNAPLPIIYPSVISSFSGMVIFFTFDAPLHILSGIFSIPFSNTTVSILLLPSGPPLHSLVSFTVLGIVIDLRFVHPSNSLYPRYSTLLRSTDLILVLSENARSSIP